MGGLAAHLVREFSLRAPKGWVPEPECELFPAEFQRRIGYQANADLVLRGPTGQRIVVELEISRADPVANQAKILIAFAEGYLAPTDTFVSMLSPHLQRGRRNLAAFFTRHMRTHGSSAFCVSLLPHYTGAEVSSLNQSSASALSLDAKAELARVLSVAMPLAAEGHRIHFAGDVSDVVASLWRWNDELQRDPALSWERRRVQYFVSDPIGGLFAPAKFCAFLPARGASADPVPPTMTHDAYVTLGEDDPRFDGHRARRHLTQRLAFVERQLDGQLGDAFAVWHAKLGARVALRRPVTILVPPPWFAGR